MSVERDRRTLLGFYDAINRQDFASLEAVLAPHFVSHTVPGGLGLGRGPAGYLEYVRMVVAAFPDLRTEVLEVVVEGDRAAARVRASGTHEGEFMGIPATGRPVDFEAGAFARFEDGALVEYWSYSDDLALMQQLGLMS